MPELRIYLDADQPTFSTSDTGTVESVRAALLASMAEGYTGPTDRHLVPAHDLAAMLRAAGRKQWAIVLERKEEADMVRVTVD